MLKSKKFHLRILIHLLKVKIPIIKAIIFNTINIPNPIIEYFILKIWYLIMAIVEVTWISKWMTKIVINKGIQLIGVGLYFSP